jgi:uncharacterized NAD(P)/FAD-binding protein YdhS
MIKHVAIVGAGFSGTLLAINLLRHEGPKATLIERAPAAGAGLAFGAAHPGHLLNVRAGNMSALPDDAAHFVRWLEGQGFADAASRFVPRLLYGHYLRALLDEACARSPGRLEIVRGEARAIEGAATVCLADGRRIVADTAVLAIGNLAPHDPPGIDADALGDLYRADPWAPGLAENLSRDGRVLILGTGLTMVDVALSLAAQGFAGDIVALSRRGLIPHVHAAVPPPAPITERPPARCVDLLRFVRAQAGEQGWRRAVDALRPITQDLWGAADLGERRRFLRHLRPWWDIHRHRLAPEVAERVEALPLRIEAGRIEAAERQEGRAHIRWRPRGGGAVRRETFDRIVNCTGPQGDVARSAEPLLAALVAAGRVRPDALRIGIDVDRQAQVIGADGSVDDPLYAIGPVTRGAFWEIVAVPDIRVQSWALARRLSHAHWVEGDGL